MSELSSCYFCGAALDAPVESYPVVPSEIRAADQRTISLCPTCRRKLETVMDFVLTAAVDADDITATFDENAIDDSDTSATDQPGQEGRATGDTSDATGAESETAQEWGDTLAQADDENAGDDSTAAADAASGSAGADRKNGRPDDTAEDDPAETASGGAADGGTGSTAAETGDGKPDVLSSSAGQSVIRLLQNREFPLDREEFQIVASNAYDIRHHDVEEVLDTLISEGYVAEDGERLVQTED